MNVYKWGLFYKIWVSRSILLNNRNRRQLVKDYNINLKISQLTGFNLAFLTEILSSLKTSGFFGSNVICVILNRIASFFILCSHFNSYFE